MLTKIARYQSVGQAFLEKQSHLGQDGHVNTAFDFSTINLKLYDNPIRHTNDRFQLLSVSDAFTINIGDPLDTPSEQGQMDNWALALDQELYIKNDTVVVWSRGHHVLKTFDFSQEDQKVTQALFAWFPIPSYQLEKRHASADQINLNDAGSDMQLVKEYWHKRGPQTLLMEERKPTWQDDHCPRRALCIVFLDRIQIYFEDGVHFTAYIPFEMDQVVPLDVGLLISRRHDAKRSKQKPSHRLSIPYNNSATSWDIASFFATITHPLLEASPVKIRRISSSAPSSLWSDPHRLLFATTHISDKKRLPVIVTLNLQDNKHTIWTYERRKYSSKPLKSLFRKRPKEDHALSRKRKRSFLAHEGSDDEPTGYSQVERNVYHTMLDPSEISLTKLWNEQKRFNKRHKNKPLKASTDTVQSNAFLVHNLNGQELICLLNKTTHQLQLVNLDKAAQMDTDTIEFTTMAKSAVPVHATRDSHQDLLFLDLSGKLWLWVDARMPLIAVPTASLSRPITELSQSVYDRFNLQLDQTEEIRYRIHLQPQSSLVRDCLAAFDCAHSAFYVTLWYRYIEQRYRHLDWTEWHTLFVSFLSFLSLKPMGRKLYGTLKAGDGFQGIPDVWVEQAMAIEKEYTLSVIELNSIIKSLHVVYEDYRIKNTMKAHLGQLGYLLMQLCVILDHKDWINYYQEEGILPGLTHQLSLTEKQIQEALMDPPNMEACLQQMVSRSGSIPVLLSFFGVDTLKPTITHCRNTYARTIQDIWSIYHAIYYSDGDPNLLVERLTQSRISRVHIETLISSIAAPILEALRHLQEFPQLTWNKEIYDIIERYDIYRQLHMDTTVCDPNQDIFKLPLSEESEFASMGDLMHEVLEVPTQHCIYESDVLSMETERLRFGFGGVIENVRIMLDASRIPEHPIPPSTSDNDDDIATEHQSHIIFLIQRTLALATGRAIYTYATYIPDLTKTLPMEPIQLAAKILPLRTIVHLDESIWNKEFLHWPQFHNGIAAGLRISPSHQVNDSWISFCHSDEMTPYHGGMLLAMGLNGILRRLTLESWYHMIRQNISLVSVGFILGIAAAYRGTEDKKVTKLLSAYIPALLDQQAAPFNQSNLILASSLLGLGLIHMNTCDIKMASVMLQELERNATSDLSGLETDYQACALAAGFSLGFIMLSKGQDGRMDPDLFKRLCLLMLGKDEQKRINLDITSAGATMALGLMYLKTEAQEIARLIEIPTTRSLLNYTRPDFLMLRVIARHLILWSQIQPTSDWIEAQIPAFMQQPTEDDQDEQEVLRQAQYNIMGGGFLCLGLRFAGSKNQQAFDCLLSYLDQFIQLLQGTAVGFQQRITRTVVRTCLDVLCTAAAMVMAGTGRRELLKRLETVYGMVDSETSYGHHMAVSMSMGLLFVGLGGYTLKTTNEAIAGLLCAFYPFYPLSTEDNRYHLQAFRHLWVLAVDSRWLMPVDVSTKKPCRVPMRMEIYEDDDSTPLATRPAHRVQLEAPMVVPDYKLIKSIEIQGERYWPLSIDMVASTDYQESIKKSGVIYVQLKEGKRSYEEDPDGQHNLFET